MPVDMATAAHQGLSAATPLRKNGKASNSADRRRTSWSLRMSIVLDQWPSAHNVPVQIERELIELRDSLGGNVHAHEFSGDGAGGD
jgi:hypothetical protein